MNVRGFVGLLILSVLPLVLFAEESPAPIQLHLTSAGSVILGNRYFAQITLSNTTAAEKTVTLNFSTNVTVEQIWGSGFQTEDYKAFRVSAGAFPAQLSAWLRWTYPGEATVSAEQEIGGIQQTQTLEIAEVQPLDPRTTLHFTAPEVFAAAYNRATERLFFMRNQEDLDIYEPKTGTIQVIPYTGPMAFIGPTKLRTGADATLYSGVFSAGDNKTFWLGRYDAAGLKYASSPRVTFGVSDFEVSPADSSLLAIQTDNSLYLYDGTNAYPRFTREESGGFLGFSADGRQLYSSSANCDLKVFNISDAAGSLVPVIGYTNVSCTAFEARGGKLYYDDGTILDLSTGGKLSLGPINPSQVAIESPDTVDVLVKTNANWVIYRINAESLEAFETISIDSLNGEPLDLIPMSAQWAAIRTRTELVVVPFPLPAVLTLQVTGEPGGLSLQFPAAAGSTYQLLSSPDLHSWRTNETISGNNGEFRKFLPADETAAFYRILVEAD